MGGAHTTASVVPEASRSCIHELRGIGNVEQFRATPGRARRQRAQDKTSMEDNEHVFRVAKGPHSTGSRVLRRWVLEVGRIVFDRNA